MCWESPGQKHWCRCRHATCRPAPPASQQIPPRRGLQSVPRGPGSSPWLLQGGHREDSAGLFPEQHGGSLEGQWSPTEKGELLAVRKRGRTPFRTGACSCWGSSGEEMRPAAVLYWGKGVPTRVQLNERSRPGYVGCFWGASRAFSPHSPRGATVRAER